VGGQETPLEVLLALIVSQELVDNVCFALLLGDAGREEVGGALDNGANLFLLIF